MKYASWLIALAVFATPAAAETYICKASAAAQLSGTGISPLADDYYGIEAYSNLVVDTDAGQIDAVGVAVLPGIVSVGSKSADKEHDVVFVDPETGGFHFRMAGYDPGLSFVIMDQNVLISGNCKKK
jgi:hypothetical protein